ncbi:MAG: phosphomannomutase/phosphoglucomutase [candidate division WOR-3 bacterium]
MRFPDSVFRMYDIRGRVPDEIDEDFAHRLGLAFGAYLRGKGLSGSVAIGRDTRLHSPALQSALADGLMKAGYNAIDLGMVPTPLVYFAQFHLDVVGAIQVSASHNPPEFNGFKIGVGHETIYGEEIQVLKEIMKAEAWAGPGGGREEHYDIISPYLDWMKRNIRIKNPIILGVDPGNGTVGPVIEKLYPLFPVEFIGINMEPDGNFPAHLPDPTVVKYTEQLRELVLREKLPLGLGFDGDGDRLGVLDERGNLIFADKILAVFAEEIISAQPGAQIVMDVKCSAGVMEFINSIGGQAILSKTGHSLIKARLKELGAAMAGEMSGHMFFADRFFGYDDAIYASMRLCEIISRTGKSISELIAPIPVYYSTPEIRAEVSPEERKFAIVEELVRYFKSQGYNVIDIDGVRLQFPDGFALARASNTQAVIVLRFEGKTPERLEEIKEIMYKKLREYPEVSIKEEQ